MADETNAVSNQLEYYNIDLSSTTNEAQKAHKCKTNNNESNHEYKSQALIISGKDEGSGATNRAQRPRLSEII